MLGDHLGSTILIVKGWWFAWQDISPTRTGEVWEFYYYAGSQKVAVRVAGDQPNANGLFYTLGDHLGSLPRPGLNAGGLAGVKGRGTSLIANAAGAKVAEARYMPWGETWYTSGYQPSDYKYTSQREEAGIGLYYYKARWYDPYLARFTQADTIVPEISQGLQAWDRYGYVNNDPIILTDPKGHDICGSATGDQLKQCQNYWYSQGGNTPEEYFTKYELNSPLHGDVKWGNYLDDCTTNPCKGIHPGIDSNNIWKPDNNSIIVNYIGREVYAAAPGTVVKVGNSQWGNYVMIEHDINGTHLYSIYAHLNTQTVKPGLYVDNNSVIGTMGNSFKKDQKTDIHLHFEVRKANNVNLSAEDPFAYMIWWPADKIEFNEKWIDLSTLLR
jgi:RHS repeat-associated protein